MNRAPEAPPPARSWGWSLALHGLLIALLFVLAHYFLSLPGPPPMEIEIDGSTLGDGAAKLGAPKPLTPGKLSRFNRTAQRLPNPPKPVVAPKPPAPPKDWVLPSPETKKLLKPVPPSGASSVKGTDTVTTPGGSVGGEGTAAKVGGSGDGSDEGVVGGQGHGGTPLLALPRLLNKDEVLAALRRFYPEEERRADHEADVWVEIHIDVNGSVWKTEVVGSASPAFDAVAQKVARLMRFAPAIGLNGKPAPVRLPQRMGFRLEAQ